MVATDKGETGFPLWPAEVYAARCAVIEWDEYQPTEIAVEELLSELLPMLQREGAADFWHSVGIAGSIIKLSTFERPC